MAKQITMNKLARVEAPADFKADGVVAFQLVEFTINFFGSITQSVLDTKIMADGSQFVIDGCGFIKEGYRVA